MCAAVWRRKVCRMLPGPPRLRTRVERLVEASTNSPLPPAYVPWDALSPSSDRYMPPGPAHARLGLAKSNRSFFWYHTGCPWLRGEARVLVQVRMQARLWSIDSPIDKIGLHTSPQLTAATQPAACRYTCIESASHFLPPRTWSQPRR